jgi:GDP-4-dehydro-6-deoxy-D-mannose reductase
MSPPFRVLVSGGDGFVGRHLVRALGAALPAGHEIIVGEHSAPTAPAAVRRVVLDVTNADRVRAVLAAEQPTHVFHLAASAAVQAAARDLRATWTLNFGGTLNVALGLAEAAPKGRLLFTSSAQVYGASFKSGRPLDETAALDPVDPYGASKAAADILVGDMARQGLRAIRLRPFNHTGAGQGAGFVVPDFAMQIVRIERGEQPPVINVGNLESRRDLLDVQDVVDAYVRAVLQFDQLPPGCAINIASGKNMAIGEILELLLSLSRAKIEVRQDPARMRTSDIPVIVGDAGLAGRLLHWKPQRDLRATLAAVLDYYRTR